jgi:hypothetical protein
VCTSVAWHTCVCVKARRQQSNFRRRSWITRAPAGAVPGSIRIGTVLFDFVPGSGAWLGTRGRYGESEKSLPGLLCTLEERRPGSPYSHRSKERVRGATLSDAEIGCSSNSRIRASSSLVHSFSMQRLGDRSFASAVPTRTYNPLVNDFEISNACKQ